jgi:hypothetical protein
MSPPNRTCGSARSRHDLPLDLLLTPLASVRLSGQTDTYANVLGGWRGAGLH